MFKNKKVIVNYENENFKNYLKTVISLKQKEIFNLIIDNEAMSMDEKSQVFNDLLAYHKIVHPSNCEKHQLKILS